ncbi:MAG: ATP synthase F1 subunit delta [Parcubacteria group bacterium]
MNVPLSCIVEAWLVPLGKERARLAIAQLRNMSQILAEDRLVRKTLLSPTLSSRQKMQILGDAKILREVTDLCLFIDRNRLWPKFSRLVRIAERCQKEQFSIRTAQVWSAVPLSENERKKIALKLSQRYGDIELREQIEPELLGGLLIDVAGQRYDASIRGRLNRLKHAVLSLT